MKGYFHQLVRQSGIKLKTLAPALSHKDSGLSQTRPWEQEIERFEPTARNDESGLAARNDEGARISEPETKAPVSTPSPAAELLLAQPVPQPDLEPALLIRIQGQEEKYPVYQPLNPEKPSLPVTLAQPAQSLAEKINVQAEPDQKSGQPGIQAEDIHITEILPERNPEPASPDIRQQHPSWLRLQNLKVANEPEKKGGPEPEQSSSAHLLAEYLTKARAWVSAGIESQAEEEEPASTVKEERQEPKPTFADAPQPEVITLPTSRSEAGPGKQISNPPLQAESKEWTLSIGSINLILEGELPAPLAPVSRSPQARPAASPELRKSFLQWQRHYLRTS